MRRLGRFCEHDDARILRPVTRSRMYFAHRSIALSKFQPHLRAYAVQIAFGTDEPNTDARLAAAIAKELHGCRMLSNHQVRPPILIEIPDRCAALFAINF